MRPVPRRLLLVVACWACARSEGTRTTSAESANWSIDRTPLFDVGAESEDTLQTFGEIAGAARLADGRVVVADRKAAGLQYFDPEGKFVRTAGRRGDGPGEFHDIMRMHACGDSLLIEEWGPRYQVWSMAGEFGRVFAMEKPDPGQSVYETGCNPSLQIFSDGWETGADRKPGYFRPQVPFWLANREGRIITRLGEHPGPERLGILDRNGRLGGSSPFPLGRLTRIALGRNRIYIGTADSLAVDVFDLEGHALPQVRKAGAELKLTPEDIAHFKAIDTLGMAPELARSFVRDWEQTEWRQTIPAYSALAVDDEDNLWIQRYPRAADSTARWIVFSPAGSEIGRVDLPLDFTVSQAGADYVFGVAKNLDDGVQHVQTFRLHRTGGGDH